MRQRIVGAVLAAAVGAVTLAGCTSSTRAAEPGGNNAPTTTPTTEAPAPTATSPTTTPTTEAPAPTTTTLAPGPNWSKPYQGAVGILFLRSPWPDPPPGPNSIQLAVPDRQWFGAAGARLFWLFQWDSGLDIKSGTINVPPGKGTFYVWTPKVNLPLSQELTLEVELLTNGSPPRLVSTAYHYFST